MRNGSVRLISFMLLSAAPLLPGTAQAHSHIAPGEHVKEFRQHIEEYEQDVRDMTAELDAIIADYAGGRDMSDRMDAFVNLWEKVRYHEAVETVTSPLYAPIWQGIGSLRSALTEGAPVEEARRRQRRLEASLWQGIGALKLAAHRDDPGQQRPAGAANAPGGNSAATVDQIMDNLDRAVEKYAGGRVKEAKAIIHDTYMQLFEGLEGGLIERDPQLVVNLEEEFNATLPLLMNQGAPVDKAWAVVARMKASLEKAERMLEEAEAEKGKVF